MDICRIVFKLATIYAELPIRIKEMQCLTYLTYKDMQVLVVKSKYKVRHNGKGKWSTWQDVKGMQ